MPPKSTKTTPTSDPAGSKYPRPPHVLKDVKSGHTYLLGDFLGTGGHADAYQVQDQATKEIFACKVISKDVVEMYRVMLEIVVQRGLRHNHIVQLYSYFEDDKNLYLILEFCKNGTLQALVKTRGVLTEFETRYFLRHILWGIKFLHSRQIIHHDIKSTNVFIHENMSAKIGDFGLVGVAQHRGEINIDVFGTPNYIAPEVYNQSGHSFPSDMWSVGVILYNCLIGHPPFQRSEVSTTLLAVQNVDYEIPPEKISVAAKELIESILVLDPLKRATLPQILCSDFMNERKGPFPDSLPDIILTRRVNLGFRERPDLATIIRERKESDEAFAASLVKKPRVAAVKKDEAEAESLVKKPRVAAVKKDEAEAESLVKKPRVAAAKKGGRPRRN